jgi:hypothetical protein
MAVIPTRVRSGDREQSFPSGVRNEESDDVITERDRHRLYQRLEEVLGSERATTMMEHLPPVGWADVATRRDLENLGNELRVEFHRELRTFLFAVVATNTALAGVAIAAGQLG